MTGIKVAIVGAGAMAREHIKAFNSVPDVNVVGLCSRTRSKADTLARELSVPLVTDNIADLARQTRADLVIIAVPELAANSVSKECFKQTWAVLLEKPAGYNLSDAEAIADAAAGREAPVFVGLNRRFYSSVLTVVSDLETRSTEKRFIHIQDQQSFEEARRYNHPELVVKHFMYANSIHNIDLIRVFARGEIVSVNQIMPWKGEETEVVLVYIVFDSGDTALYEGIWKGPGPWACSVSSRSVRWNLMPLEDVTLQLAGERTRRLIERSQIDRDYKPGFVLQAQAVIDALNGKRTQAILLEESLRTMRMINSMFSI